MLEVQVFLQEILLFTEGVAAVISIVFFKSIKHSAWKYFSIYLIVIFLCEISGKWLDSIFKFDRVAFINYFVIPLEFIFFYWLYAINSFKKPLLFYIISSIYLLSFIPSEIFFKGNKLIHSLNYTLGCLLLLILISLEYYKQINSSDILNFHKNKMFYINLGVTLFYIGTLPFWTFYSLLIEYNTVFNWYLIYFLLSGIVMYLLFSASFIWGKQNS